MGRRMLWTNEHRCILLRYRDEIPRPIVVPFIHDHHRLLQHNNARPHVARICTQFLEAENNTVLSWQHTHRTCHPLSMFGMLWIYVYDSVSVPANIQQLRTAIEEEWNNIPQTTINNLTNSMCEGDVLHCVRQMVVTPDTD